MKADKVTVEIKIEALSIAVLAGLLAEVISHVAREVEDGDLRMADGDRVSWATRRESVEF